MMFISKHKGILAGLGGLLIVVAHVALGVVAVLTARQWMSGAAIGLAVIVVVALHVVPAHVRRSSRRADGM